MARTKADLLIHPVRTRIMTAMMGRQLTVAQMARLLPEIPLPSLYRHVRLLAENDILRVGEEIRVKGALTRVYAVNPGRTRITPDERAADPREQHLRGFTTFLEALEDSFRGYLDAHTIDPKTDPVEALMEPLNLDQEEFEQMRQGLDDFLQQWRGLPLVGRRRRVIFARVFLPARPDPPRE